MKDSLSVIVASLLGSLHCVGMCGGLVSFYSATESDANASRWVPHAAYHAARLVAYMVLGALAGGFGSALDRWGARLGVGELGVFLAALTVTAWGLPLLLGRRAARPLALQRSPRRRAFSERLGVHWAAFAARLRQRPPTWRAAALGASSALLPCGWLYGFVALATTTGSGLRGAVLLLAFWSGTVPALLGLGFGIGRLSEPLRTRLPRLSAAVVLALCASTVVQRWSMAIATEPNLSAAAIAPRCHGPH